MNSLVIKLSEQDDFLASIVISGVKLNDTHVATLLAAASWTETTITVDGSDPNVRAAFDCLLKARMGYDTEASEVQTSTEFSSEDAILLKKLSMEFNTAFPDAPVHLKNAIRGSGHLYVWQVVGRTKRDLRKEKHLGSKGMESLTTILTEFFPELPQVFGVDLERFRFKLPFKPPFTTAQHLILFTS